MRRISTRKSAILLLSLVAGTIGCAGDPVAPPEGPASLTVTPSQSHAGTTVEVRGAELQIENPVGLTVLIGGEPGTVIVSPSGALLVGIPLFVTEDDLTPAPPAGPLTLVLYQNGRVIGEARDAIIVTVPPLAPGSTHQVVSGLMSFTGKLESVVLSLATEVGPEQAWVVASFAAIDTLLAGSNSLSLLSRVDGLMATDAAQMALMDRLIGAGTLLDQIDLANRQISALTAPAKALRAVPIELTDASLAARMQLHVMISDFGQQVIGATATSWGNVTSIITAIGAVTGFAVPGAAIAGTVGAVLGTVSFAINNVLLGYLPADVDAFELNVIDALVEPGKVPATEIWITTSNSPPNITVLDLVGLVLTGLGIAAGSPQAQTIEQVIDQTVNTFLNEVRARLSSYAASHPNSDLSFDFASIPSMSWRARVTNTRFVDPLTFTPAIIEPAGNNIMAWRARLDAQGEGRIHAVIKSGSQVTSLPAIPGYTYNSGAFGKDIRDTGTKTVYVSPALVAIASMNPVITPGASNGLEVRVHSLNSVGDAVYRNGVNIVITGVGGTAVPAQGTTGTDGRFNTIVQLDSGSASVELSIIATDDAGREATTTASAAAEPMVVELLQWSNVLPANGQNPLRLRLTRGGSAIAGASIDLIVGGGTASPSTGTTDAGGEFSTTVSASQDATQITVLVQVAHSGQTESVSLQAGRGAAVVADAGGNCLAQVKTASGICGGNDFQYENPSIDGFGLYTASASASGQASDGSTASGSVTSTMEVGTSLQELYFLDASTSMSLTASNPSDGCLLAVSGSAAFATNFTVSGGSVNFRLVGTIPSSIGEGVVNLGETSGPYTLILQAELIGSFDLTGVLPPGSYAVDLRGLGDLNSAYSASMRFSITN